MSAPAGQSDIGRLRLLAIMRIGWTPLWIIQLVVWAQQNLFLVRNMPDAAWAPVAFGYLFFGPPGPLYTSLLWVVAFAATIALALGWRTRLSSAVALASGLLLGPIALGWGKIGHGSQPMLLFLLVFIFTPWGAAWSLDARRARKSGKTLPVVGDGAYQVTMLLMGLLYFSSALLKVYHGFFLQPGNLAGFAARQNIRLADWYGTPTPGWSRALGDWVAGHSAIADLMGWGALILEATIIIGVLGPRFRVLASGMTLVLLGGIGIVAPLRFYSQAHFALLVGLAAFVILVRHRVAWLGRWFPAPPSPSLSAESLQPQRGRIDWSTMGLVTSIGIALLAASWLIRGDAWLPIEAWSRPLVPWFYAVFSSETMLIILLLGAAACIWAALGILRLALTRLRRPMGDDRRRVLLYDADCGFCQSWVAWAQARQPEGVEFKACQFAGDLRTTAGITMDHCVDAAYLVTLDKQGVVAGLERGAGAINGVMARLQRPAGWWWRLLSGFYLIDGVRQVEEFGYGWVARNRHRLGDQSCPVPEEPVVR